MTPNLKLPFPPETQSHIAAQIKDLRTQISTIERDYMGMQGKDRTRNARVATDVASEQFHQLYTRTKHVLKDLLKVFNVPWDEGQRLARCSMDTAHSHHADLIVFLKDTKSNTDPFKFILGDVEAQKITRAWKQQRNTYVKKAVQSKAETEKDWDTAFLGIPILVAKPREAVDLAEDNASSGALVVQTVRGTESMKPGEKEKPLTPAQKDRFKHGTIGPASNPADYTWLADKLGSKQQYS